MDAIAARIPTSDSEKELVQSSERRGDFSVQRLSGRSIFDRNRPFIAGISVEC